MTITTYQALIDQLVPFASRTGLVVEQAAKGLAQCRMPLQGNQNHLGAMYAGALFTLADITGGVLLLASFDRQRFYPILKQIQMDFNAPAETDIALRYTLSDDVLLHAEQQASSHGKAQFMLEGQLYDSNGLAVAVARGMFQIRALKTK